MIRRVFSIACALVLAVAPAVPAVAKDAVVDLTLDGRPVSGKGAVALRHHGVVFADMIALNKTFNGLMSINGKTYRTVIRSHAVAFTVGSSIAVFQGRKTTLPAAPFRLNNSLYVPLAAFGRGIGTQVRINAPQTLADIVAPI